MRIGKDIAERVWESAITLGFGYGLVAYHAPRNFNIFSTTDRSLDGQHGGAQ